jgi:hypothetical protein
MHLHFQAIKECIVRHGASNNIKQFRVFSLYGNSKPNPASFGKDQGLARGKRKRKGNARILASEEKKKIQLQNSGRYNRLRRLLACARRSLTLCAPCS